MAKNKKPTIRELEDKFNVVAYNLNYFTRMLDSLGRAMTAYINWKGDEPEFKKHIENLKKDDKLKENDEKTKKTKV